MNKNKNMLLGKKLVLMIAHPDDESFLAAGTAYENHKAGGDNMMICATRGEKGMSHLKNPLSPSRLGIIRTEELKKVAKFLKIRKLSILDIPDGKVKDNKSKLLNKGAALIKKYKPDVIVSFGLDGISGHLDHIAVGDIAHKLAKELKIPFISFGVPPSFIDNFGNLKKIRRFGVYSNKIRHPKPNLKIRINPKIKLKVLKFHKSQINDRNPILASTENILKNILRFEYFIV